MKKRPLPVSDVEEEQSTAKKPALAAVKANQSNSKDSVDAPVTALVPLLPFIPSFEHVRSHIEEYLSGDPTSNVNVLDDAIDRITLSYPGGLSETFPMIFPLKDGYNPVIDLVKSVALFAYDFPDTLGDPNLSYIQASTVSGDGSKPLYHQIERASKKKQYTLLKQLIEQLNTALLQLTKSLRLDPVKIPERLLPTLQQSQSNLLSSSSSSLSAATPNTTEASTPVTPITTEHSSLSSFLLYSINGLSDKPLTPDQTVILLDQVYARTVTDPDALRQYRGFSKEVYGETRPPVVHDIIQRTGLKAHHTFIDLGSGIGSVVLQVSAETRAKAYGIELLETPAAFARRQLAEYRARVRLLGRSPPTVHLRRGDFLECHRVVQVIQRADVVFVNNYAFESDVNHALMQLFLGMKEGARVVSFAGTSKRMTDVHIWREREWRRLISLAFRSVDHTITEYNMNNIASIMSVQRVGYGTGGVSWTASAGEYYIHTIDREPLKRFMQERSRDSGRRQRSSRAKS